MTFKEAMEHYRAGTATEEERQLVEAELEKNRLIAEYLDEQWEEPAQIAEASVEEMKKVRKSLRKRSTLTVLVSTIVIAALLLGTVFIGIPAAERIYWDPNTTSYGTAYSTDLELMLAVYAELFCPNSRIFSTNAAKTGFASYSISIQYWDAYRGGESLFTTATLEKGELMFPVDFLQTCPVNIFDRATYPFYPQSGPRLQEIHDKLAALPEYVTVLAAVSFPEDKSMEEILEFQDSLISGHVGWTAIRTSPLDKQLLPLCGMDIYQSGTVRIEANKYYPCLDTKEVEITAANLETHFKSLLQFSADQVAAGTGIDTRYTIQESYYTQVLNYVEENGIYSYGCYVSGTPETFLALIDSGAVSQIWIEDVWISI